MSFTCPQCGMTSHNPNDAEHGYCGNCHAFTGTEAARLPDLRAGIWEHWKGHLYQVLGYGRDANDAGRVTVVYFGLELDGASAGPRIMTRTAASGEPDVEAWWDEVHLDGGKCTERLMCPEPYRPRFRYLGHSWSPAPEGEQQ